MLKVSFKDDFKRVETFNNKATVVKLTGRMKLPKWWHHIPEGITDWTWQHPSVEMIIAYSTNEAIIITRGKAKCADGDTFDDQMGERIAECRAKIRIYKFMQTLTKMLCEYYHGIVFGEDVAINNADACSKNGLLDANLIYTKLLQHERHYLVELLQKTI